MPAGPRRRPARPTNPTASPGQPASPSQTTSPGQTGSPAQATSSTNGLTKPPQPKHLAPRGEHVIRPVRDDGDVKDIAKEGWRQIVSERIAEAKTHEGIAASERIIEHTMDATMAIYRYTDQHMQSNDLSTDAVRGFAEAAGQVLQEGAQHLRSLAGGGIGNIGEIVRQPVYVPSPVKKKGLFG